MFLKKKSIMLLLPLVFWAFVKAVFIQRLPYDILMNSFHLQAYLRDILISIKESGWFLKALFLCFLFLYCSKKFFRGSNFLIAIVSTLLLLIFGWLGVIPNKCYCLEDFIFLYPFFVTGYLYHIGRENLYKQRGRIMLISCLLFIGGYILFWKHSYCFYTTNTSLFAESVVGMSGMKLLVIFLLRYIVGVTGSLLVWGLVRTSCYRMEHQRKVKVLSWIVKMGQCTLAIYLLQDIILPLLRGVFVMESAPCSFLVANVITVVVCMVITLCVQMTKGNGKLSMVLWGKI